MKDLYFRYNPEPSKTLLERGQVVDGSYFLADGLLHFGDNETIECEFEVAHMQSGICWAVVYFPFPDEAENHPVWEKHQLEDKVQKATKLTGKDRLFQRNIEASLSSRIAWKGNSMFPGLRLVFTVQFYVVELIADIEDRSNGIVFCLVNLPIANHYAPERTAEFDRARFMEEVEKAALEAALQKVIETASENNGSAEELLKLGIEQARTTKEDKLNNAPPAYWKTIPFEIEGEIVAQLYWKHKAEDRQYDCQPLALLRINRNKIPPAWSATHMAEWICNLLSLSVGRMVTWNYYYVPPESHNQLPPKEYWRSRTVQTATFVALTEEQGYLSIHGFDEHSHAIKLVEQVVSYAFGKSKETTNDYLYALADYVYYASTAADDQHRCTLLCALVESLFSIWERLTQPNIESETQKTRKKRLLNTIEGEVGNLLSEVLPKGPNETDKNYEERCRKFLARIRSTVGTNLSQSFIHRLKWLFRDYGWYTDTTISGLNNMGHRTELFVESRNKLFHEHRFAYDDPEGIPDANERTRKVVREIINIEMFVPLLLSTLLQYRGRYWDRVQNNWAWMPRKESKEQDT